MLLRRINQGNKSKRGFTLAELLVVVAIIAILVAVSIPIFTGKLEDARKNTDLANERAAKAAAIADYLQSDQPESYTRYYDAENGTMVKYEDRDTLTGYNQTEKSADLKKKNNGVIIIHINSINNKVDIDLKWDILDKSAEWE